MVSLIIKISQSKTTLMIMKKRKTKTFTCLKTTLKQTITTTTFTLQKIYRGLNYQISKQKLTKLQGKVQKKFLLIIKCSQAFQIFQVIRINQAKRKMNKIKTKTKITQRDVNINKNINYIKKTLLNSFFYKLFLHILNNVEKKLN